MEISDSGSPMIYASFNQTTSRICVGTHVGFFVYTIDPFHCLYKSEEGGCSIVEILDDTSLLATVGTGVHPTSSKRLVKIYNMELDVAKTNEICRIPFETPVLTLRMNKKRLVVALETEIHLYNIENMSFFTKISTSPNPKGLCALSSGASPSHPMLLAYPFTRGSLKGDLILYDPIALEKHRLISDVHDHPLRCLNFSNDGRLIATASQAGTLIKILPVLEHETDRYAFRRGLVQSADISAIVFNKMSTLLAVSSSNGTVHVFSIKDGQEKTTTPAKSTLGMLGDMVWGEETRSFTTVKLNPGSNNLVAFSNDSSRIFTITQDGKFSQWQLDKNKNPSWTSSASVCKLVREDNLLQDYYFVNDNNTPEQNITNDSQ